MHSGPPLPRSHPHRNGERPQPLPSRAPTHTAANQFRCERGSQRRLAPASPQARSTPTPPPNPAEPRPGVPNHLPPRAPIGTRRQRRGDPHRSRLYAWFRNHTGEALAEYFMSRLTPASPPTRHAPLSSAGSNTARWSVGGALQN